MTERKLEIVFLGNPKPAQEAMKQVGESAGGLEAKVKGLDGAFSRAASVAAGFVVGQGLVKAPGFLMDAARAAAEDEAATARPERAVRNLGGNYVETMKKVNDAIAAGQRLAFTDDEVRDSFQFLAAATGDVDEALRRQAAAMDLARGAMRESRTVDGVPAVEMTFLDGFERLRRGSVSLPLQEGKRVDEVLHAICDAAGWPVARRAFDVALTTLDRYWCHRKAPLEALQEAAQQELGGHLYCATGAGVLRFENRDNRTLQPLYATASDAAGLDLSFRRDDLVSDVSFSRAGLDVASGLSVLYSLSPTGRQLAPGSDSPLNRLSGEYEVGGTNVLAPVAGVDYLANSQPDGSGADKKSQLVLRSFKSYGGGFSAGFENLDTAPIYLTLLQVREHLARAK